LAVESPIQTEEGPFQIILQVGANKGQNVKLNLTDARTSKLEVDDVLVSSREEVEEAISKLDDAIEMVSSERSKWGSYQNRLEHTHNNVSNYGENVTAAESRITDADMALKMTEFTKRNIMNQSATAMLAQSNQMPQGILQLLQ
jgi:flagellin